MKAFKKQGEKGEGTIENTLDLDNIDFRKKSRTIKSKGN